MEVTLPVDEGCRTIPGNKEAKFDEVVESASEARDGGRDKGSTKDPSGEESTVRR